MTGQRGGFGFPCGTYDAAECKRRMNAGELVLCEVDINEQDLGSHAGLPLLPGTETLGEEVAARLWSKISRQDADCTDGCWLWTGHVSSKSAPCMRIKGKVYSAMRLVWDIFGGDELGSRESLVRSCGNMACVNPAHLVKSKRGTKLKDLADETTGCRLHEKAQARFAQSREMTGCHLHGECDAA